MDGSGSRRAQAGGRYLARKAWRGEERRRRMHGAGCDGSGTGQERAAGAGERKPHMSALGRSGLGENATE
jgi:hypothetical protein